MPKDHFARHDQESGLTDWNFNILLNDQPQVGANAKEYSRLLDSPHLYPPIPTEWLHITVLRVGRETEFTEEEMLKVAELLEGKIKSMNLPDFRLGSWWLWNGNPVLHVTPEEPLTEIYEKLLEALRLVVGENRMPTLSRFIPHLTLAYNRDFEDENIIFDQIAQKSIDPISFNINKLSLIKQRATEHYYSWEIVKEIGLKN